MSVTVNTSGGQMVVPNGVDFEIDYEPHAEAGPGLAILDKPNDDQAAKWIAYYPPGEWAGVLITT